MTLELKGADDFSRFAQALKAAGDKELRKKVGAAMREHAKPLGEKVVREAAQAMPKRGGFAGQVAQARVGTRFSTSKNPTVTLLLKDAGNHDLKSLDAGRLRHPVWGNRSVWREQHVPAGKFTEAFDRLAPEVVPDVITAIQGVLDETARKA